MEQEKKCSLCDEVIADEQQVFTLDGEPACESCKENGFSYASKMYKFSPGQDKEEVIFDSEFVYLNEIDDDTEALPSPIKAQKWVNTDGWRGYTEWELVAGYVEFVGGWVTSMPDETTERKRELAEYFNDLHDGELQPPCDLYWIFGNTSNVFSQMSMIVVKEWNQEKVEKWLEEINGGKEEFQAKFN